VAVEQGRVVARDGAGHEAALTSGAQDGQPSLSPDGRWVVFLRDRAGAPEETRDLYRVRVDGGDPEQILADDSGVALDDLGAARLHGMLTPALSLDGKSVFFELFVGNSNVVYAVDLATRKVRYVTSSWGWLLIPRGPYRGQLLVMRHALRGPPRFGSYETCFVMSTKTGRDLRRVGCDPARGVGDDPGLRKELGF
jgi:Tol biopolymer transport system component